MGRFDTAESVDRYLDQERRRKMKRIYRRARKSWFWKPNHDWTPRGVLEAGFVLLLWFGLFTTLGVWFLDRVFPVGG